MHRVQQRAQEVVQAGPGHQGAGQSVQDQAFPGPAGWCNPCYRGRHRTLRIRYSQARALESSLRESKSQTQSGSTYHGTKSDQANKSILREKAQAHDDRVLERLQTVLFLASINNEEKDGRRGRWSRESVLDGGIAWVQLRRNLFGGDVLVVLRKTVSLHAERTLPDLCAHVDLAEGVEDSTAWRLAGDGIVRKQRAFSLLQRCVHGSDWDYIGQCLRFQLEASSLPTSRDASCPPC